MSEHSKKDTDDAMLMTLACGGTVEQAAAKARVSKRTVYRRLRDPDFAERIAAVRAETVERAAGMLTAASLESVKTLLELMGPTHADQVRLGAARSVLDYAMTLRESAELTKRVAELEAQVPKLKVYGQ